MARFLTRLYGMGFAIWQSVCHPHVGKGPTKTTAYGLHMDDSQGNAFSLCYLLFVGRKALRKTNERENRMVKISDFEAFAAWCSENGYNAGTREARKAYDSAHKPGATGRKNQARHAILVAIGKRTADGSTLFRKATCEYRDRHATAELLRWEMLSSDDAEVKCDSVQFIVGDELDAAE